MKFYDSPLGVADFFVKKIYEGNNETKIFFAKAIFGLKILARSSHGKFQSYDWL